MFRLLFVSFGLIFIHKALLLLRKILISKRVLFTIQMGGVGALKVGDKAKWASLIKEGQAQLTAHGYVGVRGTPAKGNKADSSVADFAALLVFMVANLVVAGEIQVRKRLSTINAEIIKRESAKKK